MGQPMEVRVLSSAHMTWSSDFAYAVGLIATDGCLSKDGRHLIFVSKDFEQVQNFAKIFKLEDKIASKKSGYTGKSDCYVIQFSDTKLHAFLVSLGLHPNKSKSLGELKVPDHYFADFLRGCLDGDGFTYSYWDKRWKSSFMFYMGFTCASLDHLRWLNDSIQRLFGVKGVIKTGGRSGYQLVFAKKSSVLLVKNLYYSDEIMYLSRKREKINKSLEIILLSE